MLVIPAIDIRAGRCVRLRQGRLEEETVFSDSPEEMARQWVDAGAERLHVVDLDGAVRGLPVNREAIRRVVRAVPVPVQLGGGIRDLTALEAYLALGLAYVILGTAAHKRPDLVFEAGRRFPGRIVLGVDARGGKVALEGWTEEIDRTPAELVTRFEGAGVAAVVYTDILRDGMQSGPNVAATGDLARRTGLPVIASGGIGHIGHVRALLPLEKEGVLGMITGRALYEGTLDLREAIRVCREEERQIRQDLPDKEDVIQ